MFTLITIIFWGAFKSTFINLKAPKFYRFTKIFTFHCMGEIFCVEFGSLKSYTIIKLIHWKISVLFNVEILRAFRFKSSYTCLKCPLVFTWGWDWLWGFSWIFAGEAFDGAVFDTTHILTYLVHNIRQISIIFGLAQTLGYLLWLRYLTPWRYCSHPWSHRFLLLPGELSCHFLLSLQNASPNQDNLGRVTHEQKGECFFLPFGLEDVEDGSIPKTGDEVAFYIATDKRWVSEFLLIY